MGVLMSFLSLAVRKQRLTSSEGRTRGRPRLHCGIADTNL